MSPIYDLLIVGGGVNGCGIARDAAGRGLSVHLCEMNDLASGTSSWSTKLIHGGLRYLEYYEFRLVREALIEREIIWKIAPHIVEPLRFVLPHHRGLRPAWLLRLGLFLYDHLGGRKMLPPTTTLDLTRDVAGAPLKRGAYRRGFEYSDCRVDDARLVALNARDAADRGAIIRTRTKAMSAERDDQGWVLTLEDADSGERTTVRGRALVNAAGPWVVDTLTGVARANSRAKVRLVQGSHIVVPKLYDHDRAYIFQNADGRIIFAIPYEGEFTLIGTTDRDYHGNPAAVRATEDEIVYLCQAASEYFEKPIERDDVVWTYSGVRPLYDDGASEAKAATRDYVFELEHHAGAPLLSIFGGKITTYRRLAEEALEKLEPFIPGDWRKKAGWTAKEALPGGAFEMTGRAALAASFRRDHPFLSAAQAARYARSYGLRAYDFLKGATGAADLGRDFGAGFTEKEARFLMETEWAASADDMLWRRSKLGLHMSAEQRMAVDEWIAAQKKAVAH